MINAPPKYISPIGFHRILCSGDLIHQESVFLSPDRRKLRSFGLVSHHVIITDVIPHPHCFRPDQMNAESRHTLVIGIAHGWHQIHISMLLREIHDRTPHQYHLQSFLRFIRIDFYPPGIVPLPRPILRHCGIVQTGST